MRKKSIFTDVMIVMIQFNENLFCYHGPTTNFVTKQAANQKRSVKHVFNNLNLLTPFDII